MDELANKQMEEGELPEKYKTMKAESKNNISRLSFRLYAQVTPDPQGIMNLILDCIVYSTETPEDFALNWEKYTDAIAKKSDKDIFKIFSEDLQDTTYDDEKESEGEYDSEDERFVVPDGEEYIEYEDREKPAKRRKMIVDSDDEEEVNGSGFYDWWW